jgi:hypothetical protein
MFSNCLKKVGDKIVLATTDFDPAQSEVLEITAVADSGKRITFKPPLKYNHHGKGIVLFL